MATSPPGLLRLVSTSLVYHLVAGVNYTKVEEHLPCGRASTIPLLMHDTNSSRSYTWLYIKEQERVDQASFPNTFLRCLAAFGGSHSCSMEGMMCGVVLLHHIMPLRKKKERRFPVELSNTLGQATAPSKSLPQLMRRHPLASYFVLAYGLAWLGWLPFVLSQSGLGLLPFNLSAFSIVPGMLLGPAFSGFLMTAVVGGKVGIQRFLKRFIDWRVGLQWYLFVLLGVPALWLLGALALPGVLPALTLSSLTAALLGYPSVLLLTFLIDGGGEEPGWRGFALPRLQTRYGPLLGTLILGVFWASWHLPLFLTTIQAGGPGVSLLTDLWHFVLYVPSTVFEAIVITWVFNNTRGSMLIAMLIHGVGDASPLPASLLPVLNSLYGNFRGFALAILLVNGVIALLLIILTRGRLSYERYEREVIQSHHQATVGQAPLVSDSLR
jgi:uncharacterized protein